MYLIGPHHHFEGCHFFISCFVGCMIARDLMGISNNHQQIVHGDVAMFCVSEHGSILHPEFAAFFVRSNDDYLVFFLSTC